MEVRLFLSKSQRAWIIPLRNVDGGLTFNEIREKADTVCVWQQYTEFSQLPTTRIVAINDFPWRLGQNAQLWLCEDQKDDSVTNSKNKKPPHRRREEVRFRPPASHHFVAEIEKGLKLDKN